MRDPRSLMVVLLMPLMQMPLLGYGVNLDLKQCRSASSTAKAASGARPDQGFQASIYFDIVDGARLQWR